MITPAQRAEIRRLFYGEHWKVGTIAAQLGLHHETVRAAVERETAGVRPSLCRPSILDPYLPFIRDTLAQYPLGGHPNPRCMTSWSYWPDLGVHRGQSGWWSRQSARTAAVRRRADVGDGCRRGGPVVLSP